MLPYATVLGHGVLIRCGIVVHAMSINGKQSNITDDDLLEIAARYSIGSARSVLAEIKEV